MEADFSGYATKAGLKCTDGRTIMPNAFQHQDKMKVPLVWQHGHKDPENVLGHAILENRPDGVYTHAFFNGTDKAKHAKELVEHGDITMLSIWANQLIERSKQVLHGAIREVSLVLSGANPGAVIENVTIHHSDGDFDEVLDDEVIIYTGIIEHSDSNNGSDDENNSDENNSDENNSDENNSDENNSDDLSIQEVYHSMNPDQKQVLHHMVGEALAGAMAHADGEDETVQDVYDSMSEKQKQVLHFMVGEALQSAQSAEHSNLNDNNDNDNNELTKGNTMKHNVFENGSDDGKGATATLSHADMEGIVADATKVGSLKEAVENYALSHGIEDIDILFPEAKAISSTPELFGRRVEWVANLLTGVRKSPFSRIKTMYADLTPAQARAKGYIKGNLKKEEFFKVAKRITTPTTIYKKQKLDRDDVVDITDFDVVTWMKGEMRVMLDEELARAILVGDGRAVDDEDKVDEERIRPIASDHEVYTTTINVNIDDSSSSMTEVVDAIVLNRSALRGSGLPTMYTTETYIGRYLTLRDSLGRKIYKSLDELATELRVKEIVPVEVLEEYPDIVAILFNPMDYVIGADRGGNVGMFDDFDIDYNQYKYLIETRCSGALVKLKAAMVVRKVPGASALVNPAAPEFDGDEIVITDQTGVIYRNADTDAVMNNAGSPYAVADGVTVNVVAEPDTGYYFASSDNDSWSFTGTA